MYKKKKRINRRSVFIIVGIIIAILLGIVINIRTTDRELTPPEKVIKDSILFIEKIAKAPIKYINNKVVESQEKKQMYEKYKELEKRIESVERLEVENQELKKQIDELKKQLKIDTTLLEYEKLNATVINRDLDYWNETITIDKGSKNGVVVNMPVVIDKGLIGKVVQTSYFTSTVKLLTTETPGEKISVKIKVKDNYIYGLLSGYNKNNNTYLIEGIKENTNIPENSVVTTTGMGDIFPSGILIGKVTGSTTDNFDLAKIVEVKSDIDFNNINYVTLLKRGV